ncbi:WD40 repeat domain-containing protein [Aulosira sp. FACHB-615]|uniref:WD40 domain-containing protein n=1 Tax=Aulosira sp. FACHB-615 TaxID=2692777 RepID=UPI001689ADFA|nr:WD40 repeat domain-containing protein [Aulosira sp. FACHB-615]MBD2490424.1 WD40 repeat domain-containing protein [Aulosira sp. FACHB-615]
MTPDKHLQQILNRAEQGQQTDEDISFLRQKLLTGDRQIVSQLGKYNVNIGEGRDIHIGDRIYQTWDEQAIQALVQAIQKVTWRCVASLTENDYTQVENQSTGIPIIDKLAKNLTDFSQQSVMRYGLKLAFSPHQEYFISSGNQVIKRWQTNTRERLQEISVPFSATGVFDLWFTSVAISSDAQLIAACKAYQIYIWRLGSSNPLHTFGKTLLSNFLDVFGFDSVAFSPNNKILAANDNHDIKLWDVESGEEIAKLSGHSDKVTCVAFNPKNGRILASCSYDKTIKLWDIDSKRCLGTLTAHRDAIYTLTFSPDGEILASGSNDNKIKLWYLNTRETPQTLQQHSDAVTCLVFSPDGKTLVSGSNDETIVEWKITEKEFQIFPERHRRGVTSIAISPDGETLISGGRDQTIKVWRR